MFERFTGRARQVIVLAQEEARTLHHNYIGTEHLLLGLLREERGVGARVLASLGVTVEDARAQVVLVVGSGEEVTAGQIPFTPRAKKVLELSLREALSIGHNYVGTEHILLGLARENQGVASRILLDYDADADKVRAEVIRMLNASDYRPEDISAGAASSPVASVAYGGGSSSPVASLSGLSTPRHEVPVRRGYGDSAWRAIELALADALRRGDAEISAENLLAGIAATGNTLAQRILRPRPGRRRRERGARPPARAVSPHTAGKRSNGRARAPGPGRGAAVG